MWTNMSGARQYLDRQVDTNTQRLPLDLITDITLAARDVVEFSFAPLLLVLRALRDVTNDRDVSHVALPNEPLPIPLSDLVIEYTDKEDAKEAATTSTTTS
jgi:hypothetical protein